MPSSELLVPIVGLAGDISVALVLGPGNTVSPPFTVASNKERLGGVSQSRKNMGSAVAMLPGKF